MAEFQEVIQQKKRMCQSALCCKCDIYLMCGQELSKCSQFIFNNPKKAEETIMSWAEDHPEPVYPTWYEFMRENKIIPDVLEDCGDYYKTIGKWLVKATIKQDIAQKLGIEPKEG